ncbi:uncharacterized protein N7459_007334 [Penicillium hispanicum]|uniref:uncharacterized protein n=1 Tax=Penicillium hispanicum TaxID=1080232 RepID=UPI00254228E0|nr:uncharacterized protein N7459_007334 [Penicillium hispanicum]KAJ5578370.1 hypothetical protein N7459_007334 [Penicillium hispanicum]
MGLFQKGLRVQSSTFVICPRPTAPGVRPPLRRLRQPRRHQSSTPEAPKEGNATEHGSPVNSNTPAKNPSESSVSSPTPASAPSSASSQTSSTAAAAAGAATTPSAANAVVRSRGLRQIIKDSPAGQFGRWYTEVQARKPYATQFYSSIVIYLCGDLSAQLLFPSEGSAPTKATQDDPQTSAEPTDDDVKDSRGGSYDPWRTVRHLIVGGGSSIPTYNWFMFLHKNFNYSSKLLSILTKVTVQQIVFTPIFNTYFFSVHSLLGGATFEETWERLKKALPVSISNSVKLWPAVTAFSFMYVPAQFRNVFAGVIAVGWQTYLSWLNQKAAGEVRAAELAAAAAEKSTTPGASNAIPGNMVHAAGPA